VLLKISKGKQMKFIKSIIKAVNFLRASSQLEYYIKSKNPKTHADVERLVREYYSVRGL
jgi:hypothetical protein